MSTYWKYYVPGWLLSAPHTLFGVLLALVLVPRSVRWSDGCVEVIPRRFPFPADAQTHGIVILYRNEQVRASPGLRVHERVHVVQGFLFGPLYVAVYVLDFALGYVRSAGDSEWAYMGICWERWAYRVQRAYSLGKLPNAWGAQVPTKRGTTVLEGK